VVENDQRIEQSASALGYMYSTICVKKKATMAHRIVHSLSEMSVRDLDRVFRILQFGFTFYWLACCPRQRLQILFNSPEVDYE